MKSRTILWFLVIGLAVLAAAPMASIGFVTVDDSLADMTIRRGLDPWDYAWDEARSWGRLQIAGYHLASFVPHLTQTDWGFATIKILSTFGAALVFCLLAREIGGSWRTGLLCGVLFLGVTQNTWWHNLLNAYPFVFDASFALALLAIGATYRYVRRGAPAWLWLAAGSFLVSIWIYETFLAYVAVIVAVAWFVPTPPSLDEDGLVSIRKRRRRSSIVPAVVAAGYLVAYWVFKKTTGGEHGGYEKGELISALPLQVMGQFSLGGVPLYHWFAFLRDPSSDLVMAEEVRQAGGSLPRHFAEHFRISWLAKSLLAGVAVWLCLVGAPRSRVGLCTRHLLPVAALLIILPNSIIALIGKYQQLLLEQNLLSHTTSCFSQFGWYLLFAVVALKTARELSAKPRLQAILAGFVAVLVGLATLATSYWNDHVNRDQALVDQKWELAERLSETPEFQKMSQKAIIYAPTLWTGRSIMGHYEDYWSKWFNVGLKDGERRVIGDVADFLKVAENAAPKTQFYYVSWHQDGDGDSQFLAIARLRLKEKAPVLVDENDLDLSGDPVMAASPATEDGIILGVREVTILTDDFDELYEIQGTAFPFPDGRVPTVALDEAMGTPGSHFRFIIDPDRNGGSPADGIHRLQSDSLIEPETISVKESLGGSPTSHLVETVEWIGCNEVEFIEDEGLWLRWTSEKEAAVVIWNHLPRDVTVSLNTSFRAFGDRTVTIAPPGIDPVVFDFREGDDRHYIRNLRITLPPGLTSIPIRSDREPSRPKEGDVRQIAVQCFPWILKIDERP